MDKVHHVPHGILTRENLTSESRMLAEDANIKIEEIIPLVNELLEVLEKLPEDTTLTNFTEVMIHARRLAAFAIIHLELTSYECVGFLNTTAPIAITLDGGETHLRRATSIKMVFRGEMSPAEVYKTAVHFTKKYLQYRDYVRSVQKVSL